MKSKIFMYLFLFTLLLVLFMYMNQKKIFEDQENTISKLEQKTDTLQQEIETLRMENSDLNYFTLQGNENAMDYFEDQGYEADEIEKVVSQNIYSQNKTDADNDLIPYAGMDGVMKINKVRFLNHKWVLADFTDGTNWGELLLEYRVEDNALSIETLGSLLYGNN